MEYLTIATVRSIFKVTGFINNTHATTADFADNFIAIRKDSTRF